MDAEACMSRSAGHCMVMGTASTMASMVEALGLGLPYNATLPAVDSRRYALAHLAGRRIVALIRDDVRISTILTRAGLRERDPRERRRSAARPTPSSTCSRSPAASACRCRSQDWDASAATCPTLVDLKPSGRFLMEDFHYAGGLPAVIRTLGEHGAAHTATR